MNFRNMLFTALVVLNCNAQPLHSQTDKQQPDVTTVAAAALGLLGLGSIGWYWMKSKSEAKKQAEEKQIKAEEALFYALVALPATTEADFQQLETLLKKPTITINKQNRFGSFPLITATRVGNQAMVDFLLFHGADINAQDSAGNTALMQAVKNGNQDMVKLLLRHGAFVNTPNLLKKSAIQLAHERHQDVIAALLAKQQEKFSQEFFDAARTGDIQRVHYLLATIPDINITNARGETALFEAVRHNHLALVKFLIDYGANLSHLNQHKQSILFPAISSGPQESDPQMLTYLLLKYRQLKDMINLQDTEGNTPLMYAAAKRRAGAVAFLIDQGAKTYLVNGSGYTVFDIAESGMGKEEQTIARILQPYAAVYSPKKTGAGHVKAPTPAQKT